MIRRHYQAIKTSSVFCALPKKLRKSLLTLTHPPRSTFLHPTADFVDGDETYIHYVGVSPFANVSNTSSPEMTTNIVNLLHESEVNFLSISCSNSTNTCLISSSARTDLMKVKSSLSASVVAVRDISFVTFKRRSDIFSTEVENR